MRDWHAFVRSHLSLPDLPPEREARIVRELAAQVEDFYRDALTRGQSDADADAYARSQVADWNTLARDLLRADRARVQSRLDRAANALDAHPGAAGGVLQMIAHLLRDVRFGLRQFAQAPGFSVVAVLTLALGIGGTSAIFSVINGVLLKPLPYPEPDGLVRVHEVIPQYGRFSVAPATFLDWRAQNQSLERIAAYGGTSATFTWAEGPERVQGAVVSWDLFELLRVAPALGGTFNADHDQPGAPAVIVLSHGLWQSRFSADPAIVGRSVVVNGAPATVLGVMPADFYYPSRQAEFWRPIAINPANATRGGHFLGVVARLKAGVSLSQAGAEMKQISERLAVQYPDASANESAEVVALHEQIVGAVRPTLMTLFAAVGVVVLIVCANVANLLLVRASVREREVALRAALGASRGRLVRQMLGESLVLAVVGGGLGLALAWLAIPAIQRLSAGSIPRVADVSLDLAVVGFALAASLGTGLVFGLVPAWQTSRASANSALKEGGRSSVGGGGRWMRNGLLVAEVALSLMLLVGAALVLRSFARLTGVDPGFRPDGILTFQVSLPAVSYPDAPQRQAFYDRLLERLSNSPGVEAAAGVQTLPMRGNYVLSVTMQGRPAPKPGEEPSANYRAITPGYFETLGIPVVRGRTFAASDRDGGPPVAVIDEAFVSRHFPGEDPIGRRIDIGNGTEGAEIVGVVGSVSYSGLDTVAAPTMYMPVAQDGFSTMWLLVRADGDPARLSNTARQAVRELDATLPAYSMTALTEVIADSVAQRRFSMLLLLSFGGVALFLAAVGLYGVVAYSVSQRTREIGLRLALGALPRDVLTMVIGGGMKLAAIGVVIGIGGALLLSSLVASLLFQVEPSDPASYAAMSGLLLGVAAVACYVPARRAMRVDPLTALQEN